MTDIRETKSAHDIENDPNMTGFALVSKPSTEEYWLSLAEALNEGFEGAYKAKPAPIDWSEREA